MSIFYLDQILFQGQLNVGRNLYGEISSLLVHQLLTDNLPLKDRKSGFRRAVESNFTKEWSHPFLSADVSKLGPLCLF